MEGKAAHQTSAIGLCYKAIVKYEGYGAKIEKGLKGFKCPNTPAYQIDGYNYCERYFNLGLPM